MSIYDLKTTPSYPKRYLGALHDLSTLKLDQQGSFRAWLKDNPTVTEGSTSQPNARLEAVHTNAK